jgi:predicted KAP-like P-loop ATPase
MPAQFTSDSPIIRFDQDLFHRTGFAEALSEQITRIDHTESIVVGLVGGWGTGKTSILNLTRNSLERRGIKVLRFNPWFFSGTEQLVAAFFDELSAQFRETGDQKLLDIGVKLEGYGKAFAPLRSIPFIGSKLGKSLDALQFVSGLAKSGAGVPTGSLDNQKRHLEDALLALGYRIVITIDDIDRLRGDEIRDVMKLVRLAADLPNITYVLLFDRDRVEQSLSEGSVSGRAYLEKIINVAFDIPPVRTSELTKILSEQIQKALPNPLNQQDIYHYETIFRDILLSLIRSPRDIKRYINTLPMSLALASHEVSSVDVLALEAIRIFLPDLFKELSRSIDLLTDTEEGALQDWGNQRTKQETTTQPVSIGRLFPKATAPAKSTDNFASLLLPLAERLILGSPSARSAVSIAPQNTEDPSNIRSTHPQEKEQERTAPKRRDHLRFEALIAQSGLDRDKTEKILSILFPATVRFTKGFPHGEESKRQWRRERRVAHPDVLAFYLETLLPGGVVPLQKFLALYNLIQRPEDLSKELKRLSPTELDTFLDRLIDYWSEIRHEHIEPLLNVLYEQAGLHPTQEGAPLNWGFEQKLSDLTIRLFGRYRDEAEHDHLASSIASKISWLPLRVRFLRLLGRVHEGGQSKISETLENEMSSQILLELKAKETTYYTTEGCIDVVESLAKYPSLSESLKALFLPIDNFVSLLKGAQFTYNSRRGPVPALRWRQLENSLGKGFLVSQLQRAQEEASTASSNDSPLLQLAIAYSNGHSEEDYNVCSL